MNTEQHRRNGKTHRTHSPVLPRLKNEKEKDKKNTFHIICIHSFAWTIEKKKNDNKKKKKGEDRKSKRWWIEVLKGLCHFFSPFPSQALWKAWFLLTPIYIYFFLPSERGIKSHALWHYPHSMLWSLQEITPSRPPAPCVEWVRQLSGSLWSTSLWAADEKKHMQLWHTHCRQNTHVYCVYTVYI